MPAGLLDDLERGRELAESGRRLVVDPVGHRVRRGTLGTPGGAEPGDQVVIVHGVGIPPPGRIESPLRCGLRASGLRSAFR
jgi:hypothetical protein